MFLCCNITEINYMYLIKYINLLGTWLWQHSGNQSAVSAWAIGQSAVANLLHYYSKCPLVRLWVTELGNFADGY